MFNDVFATVGERTFEKTPNDLNAHAENPDVQQPITRVNSFTPEPVDRNTVILAIKHLKKT